MGTVTVTVPFFMMLGLRLGEGARALVTTTPRPIALLRHLAARKDVCVVRGRTEDNENLPPDFVSAMVETYGGTRLGRQELDGELIEDVEGALWTREMVERSRVKNGDSIHFPPSVGAGPEGMAGKCIPSPFSAARGDRGRSAGGRGRDVRDPCLRARGRRDRLGARRP